MTQMVKNAQTKTSNVEQHDLDEIITMAVNQRALNVFAALQQFKPLLW